MRNGYQAHDGKKDEVHEHMYVHKDTENKHARESNPSDYELNMERGLWVYPLNKCARSP